MADLVMYADRYEVRVVEADEERIISCWNISLHKRTVLTGSNRKGLGI